MVLSQVSMMLLVSGSGLRVSPTSLSVESSVALSCAACHGADLLAQQRLTAKQWEAGVKKMVSWGALVENQDQPALVAYLKKK